MVNCIHQSLLCPQPANGIRYLLFACLWLTVEGAVFVTGCDSGMGFWTAGLLADLGYIVVAGCFLEDSEAKLKDHCKVHVCYLVVLSY